MASGNEFMSTLKLKLREDVGLVYASSCSEIDISPKYSRRFYECIPTGLLSPWDKNTDYRYMMQCADRVRDHKALNGSTAREILISVKSLFLFTWSELGEMRRSPRILRLRLNKIEDAFRGREVEEALTNWQNEHLRIIKEGKMDVDQLIREIEEDLSNVMIEVVKFPKYWPSRY